MAAAAPTLRLGLGLAVAGALFAAPVLALPGLALVLLAAGCVGWARLTARGVSARRTGLPERVTEGERFELTLRGRSGPLPLIATVADEAAPAPRRLRALRPRAPFTLRLESSFARRGRRSLAAPALRIADPLGLAAATVPSGVPASVLVLPRIEPLAPGAGPDAAGPAGGDGDRGSAGIAAGAGRELAEDPEIDGIRRYRPGTKATLIYWPAFARGAGLAERRIVAAGDAAPLIALDPSDPASAEDLDRAVRAAASLLAHLARRGGCEIVVAGSARRIAAGRDRRTWAPALAALAVVAAGDGSPRLGAAELRGELIWVAASATARPPAGLARGFIVTPGPGAGPGTAAFTVAGCSGRDLARRAPSAVAA